MQIGDRIVRFVPSRAHTKLICSLALTSLFALGCSAGADAQSLRIREKMAKWEADLAEDAALTNKNCGSAFSVKFNWAAAPNADFERYSAEGYCDAALSAVRYICEKTAGRDAVKQQIKHITCGFAEKRTIALKNGALDYKINFSSANDFDFVVEYLRNNL